MKTIEMKDVLAKNALEFAKYTITDRAIVNLSDGLKNIHRRIIWSMYIDGLIYNKNRTKSVNAVGSVLRFSPHGDCLRGSTKVFLANGEIKTIKELCEIGGTFNILCTDENGKVVIDTAHSFRIGQFTNKIYKITLSNGGVIETTNNHPVLLSNLQWVKAEDLKVNNPFYTGMLNFDYKKTFRPNITSQYMTQTLLQNLNYIEKHMVIHHKDRDINNNSLNNLQALTRKEHAKIHGDYLIGLSKGLETMFNGNEEERKRQSDKNSRLIKETNKYQGLYKAYKILKYMENNLIDLTESNYNLYRNKSGIYCPPLLTKLIAKGHIQNFDDLISKYKNGYSPVKELKIKCYALDSSNDNEQKQLEPNKSKIYMYRLSMKQIFFIFDQILLDGCKINPSNYEIYRKKHISLIGTGYGNINNRNYPKIQTIINLFDALLEVYKYERPYITDIEIISVIDEPMYDFTVDKYQNMLIPVKKIGTNKYSLICVHNSSVYQACVRLTNDSVMYPLIDGKGSFSSITTRDIQAGASRYTEMRLSPLTQELLKDIDKNVVNMVNNYDDTRLEPTDLPVTFPLVLANPNLGIAVGIASNICPFNLNDIIDNTINIIKNKEIFIMIPDFPTRASILYNKEILKQIKDCGTGTLYLRAKYTIENNSIIITEIPYTTTRESIIESIITLVKEGKIKEILDVNDYSGLEGLNITIDVKKNTDIEGLMLKLFKSTPLESTFSCNFTVLLNNKPITLGTDNILKEWILFRQSCIKKSIEFDVTKKTQKLHLLEGLQKVLSDIDKAIKIIRYSKSDNLIIKELMTAFIIDEIQANEIADMKLRNINQNYILEKVKNIEELKKEILDLKNALTNNKKINDLIIADLLKVKKTYGKPRQTEIIYDYDVSSTITEEIEDYNCMYYITKEGYIKKITLASLRASSSDHALRDGDMVVDEFSGTNLSDILVFTDKAICYKLKGHMLKDGKVSVLGEYIPSILNLDKDENIVKVIVTNEYNGDILFAFGNGRIARLPLNSYETKTNRTKLLNAFNNDSIIINVLYLNEDIEMISKSTNNKILIFNTQDIDSKKSRVTQGVQVQIPNGDCSIEFCIPTANIKGIDDMDYYRSGIGLVGSFLRKKDKLIIE